MGLKRPIVRQEFYTQSPLFSITMQSVREVRRNAEASVTKGNSSQHVEGRGGSFCLGSVPNAKPLESQYEAISVHPSMNHFHLNP
jgi:hypothetical protein